jgi:small subunit ribosomal protein S7
MLQGGKNVARNIVYDAMDIIAQRTKKEPIDTFRQALQNVAPVL